MMKYASERLQNDENILKDIPKYVFADFQKYMFARTQKERRKNEKA